MKELRPPKVAGMAARILFGLDRKREALLLVAGDKRGQWERWYEWDVKGEWS